MKKKVIVLDIIVPYIPHSQVTIEKFHYTIKKYIGKKYIYDCKKIKFLNCENNDNKFLLK